MSTGGEHWVVPLWHRNNGNDRSRARYVLRLFVTGSTPRSTRAVENLRRIGDTSLGGDYDLEVIDIYQDPKASRDAQVVAAPTLIKLLPLPMRRIIGDLSNDEKVLAGLGLPNGTDRAEGIGG